jgi:hypothetical protein
MVACVHNPSCERGIGRRISVPGQHEQEAGDPI